MSSPSSRPPFHLVRTPRKTLALVIQRDGSLEVRAPLKMPETEIIAIVAQKQAWIEKKRSKALAFPPPHAQTRQFLAQGSLPLLDERVSLQVVAGQKPQLIWENGFLQVTQAGVEHLPVLLSRWYAARARAYFPARVDLLAQAAGLHPTGVRITSARTRWGSCSARNSLSFTWRLMLAPSLASDYVIFHELAHVRVKNHAPAFWKLVESLMPGYQEQRAWLKKQARELEV